MDYTEITKPGMHDPYWYENSVGLKYIIDMLNPDNHIKYVELQADMPLGLDDVVITYENDVTRFIQVKHTRADDTLTFGDLVTQDTLVKDSTSPKLSLLGTLAKSWAETRHEYSDSEVFIVTNRSVGTRSSTAGPHRGIKRPPLNIFWDDLQSQFCSATSFSDLHFSDYEEAWKEWCVQLDYIKSDNDKLLFLKNLHIETNQENLESLGISIKSSLKEYFKCSDPEAESLFAKLDHALRTWTTSMRTSPRITVEDVYNVLSLNSAPITYNQDLIPVDPFFSSRTDLVNEIENELLHGNSKIVFLSGVPGAGKTNIVSKLCCNKNNIIDIRYYAYEPIDPGKEYNTADVSQRVKADVFWDTLLNQLRTLLRGKLFKYKVPILNSFLSIKEKKNEFFRIASAYAHDEQRIFVIAVDGLDHAARAGNIDNTFLPTLPHPEYIPDNVKILIAGQPREDYPKYPLWLREPSAVIREYIMPDIQPDDIQSLVEKKCSQMSENSRRLVSEIVCKYAQGNTLSAIFAIHEATRATDPVTLENQLQARRLSGNIQEYYRAIWEEAKRNLGAAFVDYKVAGAFAFFNEPLSADKLKLIFPEEPISKANWNNIIKALSPLLVFKNGNYTILHNDVRVYLSAVIGLDQDHVKEVYSALADYYINLPNKTNGYYRDTLRFLFDSDRGNEFEKAYSPSYVISAYVNGLELDELKYITDSLLDKVICSEELDWNHLRLLALGYMTLEQIERSKYEIDEASFRQINAIIPTNHYCC